MGIVLFSGLMTWFDEEVNGEITKLNFEICRKGSCLHTFRIWWIFSDNKHLRPIEGAPFGGLRNVFGRLALISRVASLHIENFEVKWWLFLLY